MINFPVFEQLEVSGYGLYPGTETQQGININFKPGLTLILGANGLGKTTLITILYRMLSGAHDLSRTALEATELGGASLEVKPLNAVDVAMFANRVQDLATNAFATVRLSIGQKRLTIKRHLKNLKLVTFHCDKVDIGTDETVYQKMLPEISGMSSFGDWLLLLRHMVFYFEDRRELVWDPSAQRHIFRMMFLSPEEAQNWYKRERDILALDSRYRNDTASLNRLRKRITTNNKALGDEASLRAELVSLTKLQEEDERAYTTLASDIDSLDKRRHALRKDLLAAEMAADNTARILESEKLALLKNYFPSDKQTALYLYSVLLAQDQCAVCGNESKSAAEELSTRITNLKCIVCGNNLTAEPDHDNVVSFSKEKIQIQHKNLIQDTDRVNNLKSELSNISKQYDSVATRLIETRAAIAERSKHISRIEKALPKGDEKQAEAHRELSALGEALAGDKATLNKLSDSFKELVDQANTQILQHAEAIKNAFSEYASGFLFEDAQLKWSPTKTRLGQIGIASVAFPAFNVEMSGSDFTGRTPRNGPETVSESQREFIDLAFRMALIQVAGDGAGGSLVIDAPESSLDAFFVKRAASVLCRFGKHDSNNRLIITSNLIDGQLIPEMIKNGIPSDDHTQRLINLMNIATPTAAVRNNRLEYEMELKKILMAGGIDG